MTTVDATIALTNLTDAKAFLKITTGSEDDIVSELVNASGAFANRYTSRHLIKATYTEFYDGVTLRSLLVRNFPIVSVASLYDDPSLAFTSDTLIDPTTYGVDKAAGIVRLAYTARSFFRARGNIKVVYDAGIDPAAIPSDLKEASHLIIGSWYKNFYEFQRGGVQSQTLGDRTVQTRDEDVPKAAKTILDTYKAVAQDGFFAHD